MMVSLVLLSSTMFSGMWLKNTKVTRGSLLLDSNLVLLTIAVTTVTLLVLMHS